MRERLYTVIEQAKVDDPISNAYDVFMMTVIIASLVPLAFKEENLAFVIIDKIAMTVFIIDYILRLVTADLKLHRGKLSFLIYPFTPMALIDLMCILPSVTIISEAFKIFKVLRLMRALRVFRVFKAVRYSKSIALIRNALTRERQPLITVGVLAVAYILISALVLFNVEPDMFRNYLDAIYWATVSLTTMGYGDISPVTTLGRMMTVASSIFGVAIIALPSAIITVGFMEALGDIDPKKESESENK